MTSFSEHNLSVIRKALGFKGVTDLADEQCLSILNELGEAVLAWIKGKTYTYKDQTYNLTDSTGCAIYKNGRLTVFKYYAPKRAQKPRVVKYGEQRIVVDGRQLLEKALTSSDVSVLASRGGYTLVVISEAPHGVWVNESLGKGGPNKRGKGWFDALKKYTEDKFQEIIAKY